ncbi:MAG TPA: ferredoxin reductase family protein [Acidimicrobiales bacterium]|nr:ferredoxin reductase family protein [Acidimicrobiales bacterium]
MRTHGPNPVSYYSVLLVCGLGLGLVAGLPIVDGTLSELHLQGGIAMFIGSTTGMIGTYLALLMVIMASRLPALERMLGQHGVIRWHRLLAPWPIALISVHAVFLTLSYAEVAKRGVLKEAGVIINTFPSMVSATVALGIMVGIGTISLRQIRTRIPRESWWLVHLLMYAALILSFAHELALGPSFVGHPLAKLFWTIAWLLAAGLVLTYRVGFPVYRTLRHRLKVVELRPEGPGVVSVILEGRHLDRLAISGGQFFEWRFMTPQMWWQAHPFTVSALPRPPYIRLTVQGVGSFSRAVAQLKVGTPVAIEGPYGSFTTFARRRTRTLFLAGGVGVTAARSLIEDLPMKSRPVVVIRASTEEDLVLIEEIEELVRIRKGEVHRLVGSRDIVPMDSIAKLVPDIAKRDVFISGSVDFVREASLMARRAGVPGEALHEEAYSI